MRKHQTFYLIIFVLICNGLCHSQDFLPVFNQVFSTQISHNNGVAVADYDGDNDLDIYVVTKELDDYNFPETWGGLFRNNGNGTFTEVTLEANLNNQFSSSELNDYDDYEGLSGYKYGVFWGDYNNDGFPDLFFTHFGKIQLFKNNGDSTFTEVTNQAGLDKYNGCGNTCATWFDYDNDSYLDLYISNWLDNIAVNNPQDCQGNTLYKNNGDGTFTDVTIQSNLNINTIYPSFTAFPFDFNADKLMDLYVLNDFNKPNELFINNGDGTFSNDARNYGIDTKGDDMGITIGDYNNDGNFDFFITTIDLNFLLTNTGSNNYIENATANNIANTGWSWGTKFADFDLDGDEDLFVVNGYDTANRNAEFNVYYENRYADAENTFTEKEVGLEEFTIGVEALDFDYDNDSDLDVFVTNAHGVSTLFENRTIIDPDNTNLKWFKVSLEGTASNKDAIGTILTLHTSNGQIKRYYNGVGFLGQSLKPVHFGLPQDADVVSLDIQWPSGLQESHQGVSNNSHIKAVEGQGYTELNFDTQKEKGCTDPNSCNYNPNAIVNDGSCVYLDQNSSISGVSNTTYLNTEVYTYPLTSGNSISWHVEGGDIVSGQGTNSIKVTWGFEAVQGTVSAIISNSRCASEDVVLNVNLSSLENLNQNTSIARIWNEALLYAIRRDYARPTVHARNLFHISAAMYDAWAIVNHTKPYLIGNTLNNVNNTFSGFEASNENSKDVLNKAISYAAYRLLSHRFKNSPNAEATLAKLDLLMNQLGYDKNISLTDYTTGDAAALGNFIAESYITYGITDGSNEQTQYENTYYQPVNSTLAPELAGNPSITDPNRWQSLSLDTYIDQSGNLIEGSSIDFLSPEWGNVLPFAMTNEQVVTYNRDGNDYLVYNDPSAPPYITSSNPESTEAYKWGFSMVSVWSAHLNPYDGVLWDISPKSIGNIPIENFPSSYASFDQFYNFTDGGDISTGHTTNPITNTPYETQMVPRGDYTRVLAEFWADGPDSETPPGHWFTILNYVSDHPALTKKLQGLGEVLTPLEWDVKSYFTLGGAMHDAAISAWSIKGWYDYIRPISAIRYMASQGQSTNENLPNFNANGISLIDDYIEVVGEGDPLAGRNNEHIGKIKLFAWKGHDFIGNTATDEAGVGWILADNWWPYQRPSFVTPPFAGYVSGHSTYSRAAAEVMTLLTGSEYFPNGMGEFVAKKDEFLVFEQGPSTDVVLQWATYRDASDQCSLSRIWGGIHPPADDIPGRIIGEKIGIDAFNKALGYFQKTPVTESGMVLYPNPIQGLSELSITHTSINTSFELFSIEGRYIPTKQTFIEAYETTKLEIPNLTTGIYILKTKGTSWKIIVK
ncbi:FG-GAP-like repeat-containing protein [uncultured Algibacter sp.]|uniref:FG-GAP-like repeat-containing protein n=1 Tax=uncultured Algibacter sp. TaxID=298659 RepID=UPI00261C68E2|nr:FG-GAP-like repeat-containing protein [uncultured Algibacter sp.]